MGADARRGDEGCSSGPHEQGMSLARRVRSSPAVAAFGTGSARVLSPDTSPRRGTLLASEFPEGLWVPP